MADTPVVHRWTGEEARLLRQALRLSVRAFAEHLGVAVRTVAKWEAGLEHARPKPDSQAILDTALRDADSGSRELFGVLLHEARAPRPEPALPPEDDVRRRELLGLASGTIASGLLPRLEPLRRQVDAVLTHPTNQYDVEEWERTAGQYAHLVGRSPTTDVIPQLLTDLDEARLRTEHARDETRSQMVRVCALLSALTAICLVEIGHSLEAERYWRTAQRAAQVSGDKQLHVLIRGRRAVFALYGGMHPSEILQLAADVIEMSGGTPSVGNVSAYAARAQVLAEQSAHSEARAALADVEAAFEKLPENCFSVRQSQWSWSEQRLRHVQSWVHSCGGHVAHACAAQDAALTLYSESSWKSIAQVQLHRAACMVAAGDPSEGLRHMTTTLESVPPNCRHDALIRYSATRVLDSLSDRASKLPDVKNTRELLALP